MIIGKCIKSLSDNKNSINSLYCAMKKLNILLLFVLFLFVSCETEMDKYYKLPDNLKGNAWEVLEAKGNFSIFLAAVEKSPYKDLVQGKGQITVMAPTDDAFNAYFQKKNITSIDDISQEELNKLVAYHLVYYSFNKERFENYNPEGIEAATSAALKGLYYKFRTKSRDEISSETDFTDNNRVKKIMHKERFLPIFSYNLFQSKGIDAKYNYEYFYHNSTWTGENGFNVSNASVEEYALVTDNGYVYTINQVIEPLETIYKELSKATNYSKFKTIYDKFINYQYDANASANYGNGDSLFLHNHLELPFIASEWTNDPISSVADYAQLTNLSKNAMNVFAPDNTSLDAFYNKYWKPFYADKGIENVNFIPLLVLLSNHVYKGDLLFPETIEKGNIKTKWGNNITFDTKQAKLKQMCVNGALYGLDKVVVPPAFDKVTSPMFCNPAYNMFLDMSMNFLPVLLSDANNFKIFYPSDSMIINNTTLGGSAMQYVNTNTKKYGAQEIQIEGLLGMETMKNTQKTSLSGNHIAIKQMSSRGNEAIYRTINPYNYIYTKGNIVYSSATYNSGMNPATFTQIENYSNGTAFSLQGDVSALTPESSQFKDIVASAVACPAEFTAFNWMVEASSIHKTTPPFNFLQGNRFIAFIPQQSVVENDFLVGKIPWSPSSALVEHLKYYFVDVNSSNLLEYPFPGAGIQGELTTFKILQNGETAKLTLIDTGNGLKLKDGKGNTVNVLSYYPRIYADGVAYLIDGLLEVQ